MMEIKNDINNPNLVHLIDVAYIRKYHRFNMNMPFVKMNMYIILFFALLFCFTLFAAYHDNSHIENSALNKILHWTYVFMPLLLCIGSAGSLLRNLKFVCIKTPYLKNENKNLILSYLNDNNILSFNDEDIIAIYSVPVYSDNRECVIFVIDDNTILMNHLLVKNNKVSFAYHFPQESLYEKVVSDIVLMGLQKK